LAVRESDRGPLVSEITAAPYPDLLGEHRPALLRSLLSERLDESELGGVLGWLGAARSSPRLRPEKVSLAETLSHRRYGSTVDDLGLRDQIVFVKCNLREREIPHWTQPLLVSQGGSLCGLLVRKDRGRYSGLMQVVEEPGIIGGAQIGPTVQVGMSADRQDAEEVPYHRLFATPARDSVLFDVPQSQEGGRFFRDAISYLAILPADAPPAVGVEYRWIGLSTLKAAITTENTVNLHARTLLCMLA
jgi:oxidase EvaA